MGWGVEPPSLRLERAAQWPSRKGSNTLASLSDPCQPGLYHHPQWICVPNHTQVKAAMHRHAGRLLLASSAQNALCSCSRSLVHLSESRLNTNDQCLLEEGHWELGFKRRIGVFWAVSEDGALPLSLQITSDSRLRVNMQPLGGTGCSGVRASGKCDAGSSPLQAEVLHIFWFILPLILLPA